MTNKSNSKAVGESKDEVKKPQSATPSIDGEHPQNTSATLVNSAIQAQSPIGFQPTVQLDEDEFTVNANLVLAFAAKLGVKVFWKKLKLGEKVVFALCFPEDQWTPNSKNGLTYKK